MDKLLTLTPLPPHEYQGLDFIFTTLTYSPFTSRLKVPCGLHTLQGTVAGRPTTKSLEDMVLCTSGISIRRRRQSGREGREKRRGLGRRRRKGRRRRGEGKTRKREKGEKREKEETNTPHDAPHTSDTFNYTLFI